MASFAFFSGVNPAQSLIDNETGYIGRDATVEDKINVFGDSAQLRVDGVLFKLNFVALTMEGTNNFLQVGKTGLIQITYSSNTSAAAVELLVLDAGGVGTGRIFNAGEIIGNGMGIYARATDADDIARIRNTDTGTIAGQNDGMHLTGSGTVVIGNSGSIEGFRYGISNDFFGFTDTKLILKNGGTVYGMDAAVQVGNSDDKLVNWGTLDGEVRMGGGADFVKNTNGIAIDQILLEDGDDRFIGNAAQEDVVDGGAGRDILDFRQQGGAIVALDDSFDTGGSAAGDTYTNFETIWGSRSGDDVLRGNGTTNLLMGNGGDDWLDGAGGSDSLRGGFGQDTLTGGWGNDTFAYDKLEDFGDIILDFSSSTSGNDDRFAFVASAIGGGLSAGALAPQAFRSYAGNAGLDSNDRFIFNTTDQTLWFDVDGNGSKAPVLIADLQDGAVVSYLDIVLI